MSLKIFGKTKIFDKFIVGKEPAPLPILFVDFMWVDDILWDDYAMWKD